MRILIIHQNFVDHQHAGGTRHLDIATKLVKKGHEVTIVASNVDYLTGEKIDHTGPETYDGVRVVRAYAIPAVQKGLLWRVVSYLSFIPFSCFTGLRVGPVDVVLATTPPIFQLPSTWLVAVCRRAPFVLEVRDLWPDFAIGMGVLKNRLLIGLARTIEWFFYRRATHLVANSPAYCDYLVDGGIPRETTTFIPMGVDIRLFSPESDGAGVRKEHSLGDKFVVTYAGSLGIANDLDTLIDAAQLLQDSEPDIQVFIAGGGKERQRLETRVRDLGLTNVTFGGSFAKENVGEVLAASNVCVATLLDIPEFRTPFPNKVFDYMAAGRPIVLGIDGVIRDVVEKANAGLFVQPGDGRALAETVVRIKSSPEMATEMGRAGRRCAEQQYDVQLQAERFENVFTAVAALGVNDMDDSSHQ